MALAMLPSLAHAGMSTINGLTFHFNPYVKKIGAITVADAGPYAKDFGADLGYQAAAGVGT